MTNYRKKRFKMPNPPRLEDAVKETIGRMKALDSQFRSVTTRLESNNILLYASPPIGERFIKHANVLLTWLNEVMKDSKILEEKREEIA